LIAIADQMAGRNLGYINPALYQIANNPAKYANDFFDVTANCNQTTSIPGYCASPGGCGYRTYLPFGSATMASAKGFTKFAAAFQSKLPPPSGAAVR
jgi:hypothetical protein